MGLRDGDGYQRSSALRLAAGAVVFAGGLTLIGISAAPVAIASPTPDELALATLDNIVQGDDTAATAHFDPRMQAALPAQALGQAWTNYQQTLGPYQSHGDPEDLQRGDLTVVNVPLQMAHAPGQFRLTVHPDGTIAGLFFLRQGVPVP